MNEKVPSFPPSKKCAFNFIRNFRRKQSDFCFGKPLPSRRHYSSWLDGGKKTVLIA